MFRLLRVVLLLLVLSGLAACGAPTLSQARATAVAGGCWPYGVAQPLPTETPRAQATSPIVTVPPTVGPGTPTPTVRPSATPEPPLVVYPTCTPAPLTPTLTPEPTSPPPTIPPQTPQRPGSSLGGREEVGDPAGTITLRGMGFAYNPVAEAPVVSYISYGWTNSIYGDGLVWVRAQSASGGWSTAQSVNPKPVTQYYGGARPAVLPDGTIVVAYGQGDPKGDASLWLTQSTDLGRTWSAPVSIGRSGGIYDLDVDKDGGLHILISDGAVFDGVSLYGYRAPGSASWQWSRPIASSQYIGELALLNVGGALRRVAVITAAAPRYDLGMYRSDDGVNWTRIPFEYDRLLPGSNPTVRPTILAIPRGDGLIAVAWSSYGAGGVFATVSQDGGESFGPVERIAQHNASGEIDPEWDYGVQPSLAYDVVSDRLAAVWVEVETGAGEVFPWPTRSYLAVRALDAAPGSDWQYAVTPQNRDQIHPPLVANTRALLFGSEDGRHHWLITLDERNYQFRVNIEPVYLPALLDAGQS